RSIMRAVVRLSGAGVCVGSIPLMSVREGSSRQRANAVRHGVARRRGLDTQRAQVQGGDGFRAALGEQSADELEEVERDELEHLRLESDAFRSVVPEQPALALAPGREAQRATGDELVARREHADRHVAPRALLEEGARAAPREEESRADRLAREPHAVGARHETEDRAVVRERHADSRTRETLRDATT